ncbi:hypothetical protein P3T76_008468 [Phytophthora citrophthora]|uniref:Uncharacterized protein n=1 Tax=Phytophthora citrophthora TaxID=4793 RepID=A0AAD9LKU9_9STRA|nr:hypothetical protein P3T76_008468 [Phytophthora citrophthora]
MARARIRRRRQQFQAQFDVQSRELKDALILQLASSAKNASVHARLVLQMQYRVGELCAEYGEFNLAIMYFQQSLASVDAAYPSTSEDEDIEIAAFETNAFNWLAVMHWRAGNQSEAMENLLEAKRCSRGEDEEMDSSNLPASKGLNANYALFLYAKGNVIDAENAAELVVGEEEPDSSEEDEDDTRARSIAFMLLASIYKARGASDKALKYAERAVALADRVRDPRLISRAHNNLGIYCLEQGDVERAFSLFTSAYRATQQTKDFEQQATVKYHLGIALSYLGRELKQDLSEDEEEEKADEIQQTEQQNSPASHKEGADAEVEALKEETTSALAPALKTPADLFLESENLTCALPEPDNSLRVLTQSCRGEEEYYAGDFHTAEAEFTIALGQLNEFSGINIEEDEKPDVKTEGNPEAEEDKAPLPTIDPELAKLHGLLLGYTGCTQLVEGKFPFAERSHKRDLALALRQEDLHAQHRALRNLAIVYNATQRYVEAIPLWREALELAVILDLKVEQLMAYSGMGSALRELLMIEGPGAAEAAGLKSGLEPMQPLEVFLKQRALAEEIGDVHQQILAQKHIVSVYESPISKPQSDSEASEALERRLSECDTLVRLCEKYENLQYRADAYRSLANALTSQLVRLRARATGDSVYGLAEAIAVLSQKRNSVCDSFQEANVALSTTAALMFQDVYEEGQDEATEFNLKLDELHPRPPLTRLEILQR